MNTYDSLLPIEYANFVKLVLQYNKIPSSIGIASVKITDFSSWLQ